tara:strand:- start:1685 stop:2899 length:1215 start_codon:yes stop_codon:yes gene_type:complete
MYFARLITAAGLSSFLLLLINCSEDPIQADLSTNDLSLDTLLLQNISGFTYQISPDISAYKKLYIGNRENFTFPSSLLKFPSNGWGTFLDSSVTIDSIFLKVYTEDSLLNNDLNLHLFYINDSIFSEQNSHIADLYDLDFSSWNELGTPNISVRSDTSDTISFFQETILSWDLSPQIISLSDTTNYHRTFSLSFFNGSDSSFVELFSREYNAGSLDPKIEIYYRSVNSANSEETLIDTLTRIVYVSEDISTIDNSNPSEIPDNTIMLNRGRGYRSIINIPFDSLSLPFFSIIRYANLFFYQKEDSLDSYSIRMEPLIGDINNDHPLIFNSDPYENLGAHFSNSSTSEGKLQISLKSYFQSVLMVDTLKNAGMKFYSSINNSLFDTVEFDLDNDLNRVEILYAAP